MSDFKVGDRVEYVGMCADVAGAMGVITELWRSDVFPASVKVSLDNGGFAMWSPENCKKLEPAMTESAWSDLLRRVEALERAQSPTCSELAELCGGLEEIAEDLRKQLNGERKRATTAERQLAGVTEDCAMWKEKWEGEKRNAEAAERRASRFSRKMSAARDELTTAKKAMHQQEQHIQRACELLREVLNGKAFAIQWNDDMMTATPRTAWKVNAAQFLTDNDAIKKG